MMFSAIYNFIRKVRGLDFQFSSHENGLWFDSDKQKYTPTGFGIKFTLYCGKLLMPVPNIFKSGWWKNELAYNPWSGEYRLFTLRIPFIIFPYFSIALYKYGFYIGVKEYGANKIDHPHYLKWMKTTEIGSDRQNEEQYLCFTSTTRKSRW